MEVASVEDLDGSHLDALIGNYVDRIREARGDDWAVGEQLAAATGSTRWTKHCHISRITSRSITAYRHVFFVASCHEKPTSDRLDNTKQCGLLEAICQRYR